MCRLCLGMILLGTAVAIENIYLCYHIIIPTDDDNHSSEFLCQFRVIRLLVVLCPGS